MSYSQLKGFGGNLGRHLGFEAIVYILLLSKIFLVKMASLTPKTPKLQYWGK